MRISDWSSDVCSSDLPGEFLQDWRQLAAAAQATPGVVSAGPAIERGVVASVNGRTYAADLQGLPPDRPATNPLVQPGQALVPGHAPQGDGEIVIGRGLAEHLGVYVGDPVSLVNRKSGVEGQGVYARVGQGGR